MTDSFNRVIDYMRISITDRCNMRCKYCMPEDLPLVSHSEVLRREEFVRMARIASECGVSHIKITGGEPFVRRDCIDIIRDIKNLPKIEAVTLTTNGALLCDNIDVLAKIGIDGVNISLDTLDGNAYLEMTGTNGLESVLKSLDKTVSSGIKTKINCVAIRGFNDGQYLAIARLAEDYPVDVRFIETMPIGFGKGFAPVDSGELLSELKKAYPDLKKSTAKRGFGPAGYYESAKLKGKIGFIDAVSRCFCESCNRVRLTSEGFFKLCLYHGDGTDFRSLLRGGATDGELIAAFKKAIGEKPEKHLFDSGIQAEKRGMSRIGG